MKRTLVKPIRSLLISKREAVAFFSVCVAVSSFLIVGCRTKTATPPQKAATARFQRVPPAVSAATIQPLSDSTVLLEITFAPDERLKDTRAISIYPHNKEVRLRDDGRSGDKTAKDGVFSAIVQEDFNRLISEQERVVSARANPTPRAVFRGREIVGIEDPATLQERARRLPDVRRERRIDLFNLASTVDPLSIDPERSLMITHPSVVQDPERTISPCPNDPNGPGQGNPNGVWTFKRLMTEIANTPLTSIDPSDLVEKWLLLWDSNQPISSGFIAPPRPAMRTMILNNWPRVGGKLDLDRSPFRLAAIVNRIDLSENLVYGGGSAGEGRFVFGLMNLSTEDPCDMLPFSLIFEYGVTASGCAALRNWAQQWVDLGNHSIGTPAYNAALEGITKQFADRNAAPTKPNGSALNQLRSNENGLDPLWELREFRISASSHLFFEDTTKQTIDETLNGSVAMRDYVNLNEALIVQDKHVVPDRFPSASDAFMAANSLASPSQLTTHFRAPGIGNNEARHHFSLNTCTACHIRETSTIFLHVDPRTIPATLSRFLTGSTPSISDSPDPFTVVDPVMPPNHSFNDLDRRRQKLANLAGTSCFLRLLIPQRIEQRFRPLPDGSLPQIRDPRIDGINDPIRMVH